MEEIFEVSAKTVSEAYAKANILYGGEDKDITCEIVSEPKKGLFGIGSKDAVIRVTVTRSAGIDIGELFSDGLRHDPDKPKEQGPEKAEEKEPKHGKKDNRERRDRPEKKDGKDGQGKKNRPERPEQKNASPEQKQQKRENAPVAEKNQPREEKASDRDYKKTGVSEDEMKYALEFVRALIADMGLSATAEAASAPEDEEFTVTEEASVYPAINITGDDKGILIGHHGETLDAIQFLVNLSSQRRAGIKSGRETVKIKIDVENYRAKREEALRILARKMAGRAVKYKKNMFLEPMNPYERRIIHSELQSYPGVSTHSVGSDKNRKIVISYEGK
ncbi:MAG: Jag N-terminal domain-containing protein [Clostridia bacterium]|nr:Jag N-terminal domain-containing protein [Clostridia bacterium]